MRAFTLIEAIVTVAIFTIIMGALAGSMVMLYRTQNYAFQQSTAINEARKGIEIMVKEIREARTGDEGSYIIEKADDNEFILYSDIDKDNEVERVRYFVGGTSSSSLTQECVTFSDGGSCSVSFSDFFTGTLDSAQVIVSVEGDFGSGNEYADISADGISLGQVCQSSCNDCAASWQGSTTYDVSSQADDNFIEFTADASSRVNDFCDWQETNHAMKARFEFSWTESFPTGQTDFQKGVIQPTGWPISYPLESEELSILSRYIRNQTPIFKYFDKDGNEITQIPARPEETTLMRVNLIINVDPNRTPSDFDLESDVQIRNLKTNL